MGGLVGESKRDLMKIVPDQWKPLEFFLAAGSIPDQVLEEMAKLGMQFPIICKPDLGERGLLVKKIEAEEELELFLKSHPVDFVVQEYIDLAEEVSVLHFRFPGKQKGEISSITLKTYLEVEGDGEHDLEHLIRHYPRAFLQFESLKESHGSLFRKVLEKGEKLRFHTMGNHSKGCTFLDGRHLKSDRLLEIFDRLQEQLPGVNYARYDIKCDSWEQLLEGRFQILEINGVKSEPAHIYQPGYSYFRGQSDIFWHWRKVYQIALELRRQGEQFWSFRQVREHLSELRRVQKSRYQAEL